MSREGTRRRLLTPEERVLWTMVTKTIAPLHSLLPLAEADAASGADEGLQHFDRTAPAHPAAAVVAKPSDRKPSAPPLAPLGRRMRARVARGKESIDARLDLHGLTQAQAHSALLHFLRNAQGRGARLVLVITGKGVRGDGERGVLRRQVPQWLGLPDFRAFVVGFEDAHVAHGGEGAIYVRVRRAQD